MGANMVKSLRYWLQAVGLTSEISKSGKRFQSLTQLGQIIFERDIYFEEIGTLHLLQYWLASQKKEATAWYFFFNEFAMKEFSREDFVSMLQNYAQKQSGELPTLRSLNDDFQCIVNTYLPRYKLSVTEISPENNIDCPLGELGLIDIADRQKKNIQKKYSACRCAESLRNFGSHCLQRTGSKRNFF